MALVTIQRSPSPSNTPDPLVSDVVDGAQDTDSTGFRSPLKPKRSQSALKRLRKFLHTVRFITGIRFSESYLAVKGAALIIPQSECSPTVTRECLGDIQAHLQCMFYLLRPADTIKVAVKLESCSQQDLESRYLVVVTTMGVQDTEESALLGVDIVDGHASIGLVLPIWGDLDITLDGDGGFSVTSDAHHFIFKPVSVQAMWSALQSLTKVRDAARSNNYFAKGLTHTWVLYYGARVTSHQAAINEWHEMEDIESRRVNRQADGNSTDVTNQVQLEKLIKTKLKEVMMTVDLEEVTSKYLRESLEAEIKMSLKDYKHFIDEEMIVILRQMDSPSKIFDYLYLGSEWNASNFEELQDNGVKCILNVTREIDNFFPGNFEYFNVREWDVEVSNLLKYWDKTFKFIAQAKQSNRKVLVHCKMGVSRSASTVIAFAMKEYGWSLEEAYQHVKKKRTCIKPNSGFMTQLITYQGILDASKQRHSQLWRSVSTGNLAQTEPQSISVYDDSILQRSAHDDFNVSGKLQSCSPQDGTTELLMKAQGLASGETSEEDHCELQDDPGEYCSQLDVIHNWEDDISSYSTESIDDGFPEMSVSSAEQREILQALSESETGVLLLSYKPLPEEEAAKESVDASAAMDTTSALGEESDTDEWLMNDDTPQREERGAYDISMLTGYEEGDRELVLHERHAASAGEEDGEQWAADALSSLDPELQELMSTFVHPDVKLEYMQKQQRRRHRIEKMLQLSQARLELDRRMDSIRVVKSTGEGSTGSSGHRKVCKTSSQPTRVKPDDFWIKDTPPSPQGEDEEDEMSIEEMVPLVPIHVTPPSEDAAAGVELNGTHASTMDAEDSPEELHSEAIPWNPGTVKRQTQDLEEKIRTTLTMKDIQATAHSVSTSSGSDSSVERMDLCCRAIDFVDDDQPIPLPLDLPRPRSYSEGQQLSSPPYLSPAGSPCASPKRCHTDDGKPVSSIYESEDIQLEPGLVLKTRLEIEERARSGSLVEGSPARDVRPVQRSSSWRTERTTKRKSSDRDSERRKTCLPVLTPSGSVDALATAASPAPDSPPTGGTPPHSPPAEPLMTEGKAEGEEVPVKVVKIGEETVEMVENQVRRRTQNFEELSREETEAQQGAQLLLLPGERDRSRSQSPFVAEGLVIPEGSVRLQTKEIEHKYGFDDRPVFAGETPKSSESDNKEAKVTDEIEVNSKEFEAIENIESNQTEIEVTVNEVSVSDTGTTEPKHTLTSPSHKLDREPTDMTEKMKPTEVPQAAASSTPLLSQDIAPGEQTDGKLSVQSAYPEEDIPWSVGTVRQQMEVFESRTRDTTPPQEDKHRMSVELLTLIRQVGSVLLDSPRPTVTVQVETPSGQGRVRQVTRMVESDSDSKERHFQRRMVLVEQSVTCIDKTETADDESCRGSEGRISINSVVRRLDLGNCTPDPADTSPRSVSRSVSLREKRSPYRDTNSPPSGGGGVNRSASLRGKSPPQSDYQSPPSSPSPDTDSSGKRQGRHSLVMEGQCSMEEVNVKNLLGLFENKGSCTSVDSTGDSTKLTDEEIRDLERTESDEALDKSHMCAVDVVKQMPKPDLENGQDRTCKDSTKSRHSTAGEVESCTVKQGNVTESLCRTASAIVRPRSAGSKSPSRSPTGSQNDHTVYGRPSSPKVHIPRIRPKSAESGRLASTGICSKLVQGNQSNLASMTSEVLRTPITQCNAVSAAERKISLPKLPSEKAMEDEILRPRTLSDTTGKSLEAVGASPDKYCALATNTAAALHSNNGSPDRGSSSSSCTTPLSSPVKPVTPRTPTGPHHSGGGYPRIPISPECEPNPSIHPRKVRKQQGKSHPLSKLTSQTAPKAGRSSNPFYNTM